MASFFRNEAITCTLVVLLVTVVFCGQTQAIIVTPTLSSAALEAALLGGGGTGIDLGSVTTTVSGNGGVGDESAGTYTNASGTYGIGPGIVLGSGRAADYGDGPSTSGSNTTAYGVGATAAQDALLDPVTGALPHFDVTQIDIDFDMLLGFTDIFFNVTFGSEEWAEFVGSSFVDGFALYVNGTNIAFVDALAVNIDHPDFIDGQPGTELDGVLNDGDFAPFVHTFSSAVLPTGNTLTLIVSDTSDDGYDSMAYISALGGTAPPAVDIIPEPSTLILALMGILMLSCHGRRRRRR